MHILHWKNVQKYYPRTVASLLWYLKKIELLFIHYLTKKTPNVGSRRDYMHFKYFRHRQTWRNDIYLFDTPFFINVLWRSFFIKSHSRKYATISSFIKLLGVGFLQVAYLHHMHDLFHYSITLTSEILRFYKSYKLLQNFHLTYMML